MASAASVSCRRRSSAASVRRAPARAASATPAVIPVSRASATSDRHRDRASARAHIPAALVPPATATLGRYDGGGAADRAPSGGSRGVLAPLGHAAGVTAPAAVGARSWAQRVAVVAGIVVYIIWDEALLSSPVVASVGWIGAWPAFLAFSALYGTGGFVIALLVVRAYARRLA